VVGNKNPGQKGLHSLLYTRLLCGLRKGHHYRLTFRAWSSRPVFDSLGVYFSTGDFLYEQRPYWKLTPALLVRDEKGSLASENIWQAFDLDYTATGEETDIAIGSFKRQPFSLTGEGDKSGNFFLYIDKISLQVTDPHELLCKSADSMRTVLYNVNERHDMLEKRKKYYKNTSTVMKPPATIEQHIDTLVIPDILFATGKATLNPASHAVLDSFCTAIAAARGLDSLVIGGHTDSVGSLQYNYRLSADRANAVEKYMRMLDKGGIPKVYVRYYAFLQPVAPNNTPEGRTRNRRVEILLYRHD
ncbi:MAG: OmpA family protein, partial [Bacteroidetes bacterium]|nr:OmpA family protein [Bacteroidota bacterium]